MSNTFVHDEIKPVSTTAGLLHGYCYNGVNIFKGVPYARAERFGMPQAVAPWDGVKEATSYGFVCPLLSQETPNAELMVPHRYWPMSEHCQSLNIWSGELGEKAKKPVMVWIHGGGFTAGSSIEQVSYDGTNMCLNGDVVVVSINHRLNILGYLDLSPFGEKYANSANAGHADMVAALQWIHDNIAAFGGDPDNVTLFGQSGGGMKITGLMNIPAADGLFHKAIVMSGVSDGTLLPEPRGDGRQIVGAILAELGLGEGDVEKLETVPYSSLADAYNKVMMPVAMTGGYVGGAPMPNGYYMGEPLLHGFTEHAKTIPLMVGTVFGEFAFAPPQGDRSTITDAEAEKMLAAQLGERTGEILKLFREAYPEKHILDLTVMDRVFRKPSKDLAILHSQGGKAPSYLYNFTLDFPIWQNKAAWHCSDIPFFFHNTDLVEVCAIPEVTEKLEQQVFDGVVSFAKTANPNHALLPQWDAVTADQVPTMIFDRNCRVGINYDDALLTMAIELFPPFNLMAMMAQDIQH